MNFQNEMCMNGALCRLQNASDSKQLNTEHKNKMRLLTGKLLLEVLTITQIFL